MLGGTSRYSCDKLGTTNTLYIKKVENQTFLTSVGLEKIRVPKRSRTLDLPIQPWNSSLTEKQSNNKAIGSVQRYTTSPNRLQRLVYGKKKFFFTTELSLVSSRQ